MKKDYSHIIIFFAIGFYCIGSVTYAEVSNWPNESAIQSLVVLTQVDDWYPVPFVQIYLGDCSSRFFGEHIISSDLEFNALLTSHRVYSSCPDFITPVIDFSKYTLVISTKFADCKARFDLKIFRNDIEKSYRIIIREFQGGCRGTNIFTDAVLIPRVNENYGYDFVYVDDDGNTSNDNRPAFDFFMRVYDLFKKDEKDQWKDILSAKYKSLGDEYINARYQILRESIVMQYSDWALAYASIRLEKKISEGEQTSLIINDEVFSGVTMENGELKIDVD